MDGLAEALAGLELFLDTLIDDHVRIDRHTQRQDETGDTGQRQDGAERGEDTEQEDDVGQQRDVSGETGALVEEHHVDQHQEERDEEGDETGTDRFGTEGRTDDLLLDDRRRSRQLTGLQDVRKVGRFLHVEVAGDFGVASGNLTVHDRVGIDGTVEDDGDLLADVLLGQAGPDVGAFGVHRHRDGRAAVALVAVGDARVGHDTAVERSLAVTGGSLDGHELVDVVAGHVGRGLHGPHRTEFRREDLGDLRHREIAVDGRGVRGGREADQGGVVHLGRLEHREERVLLLVGVVFGVAVLLGGKLLAHDVAFGGGSLFHGGLLVADEQLGEGVVGLNEVRVDFGVVVGGPEFEGCGTLEQLPDALRLLDAREFDEDAARVADLLDRRLGHAETVDTVAENVEGVGNGAFGVLADDGEDFGVRGLGTDALAHLIGSEHLGKALTRSHFLPGLAEEGDEVGGGVHAALFREGEGAVEFRGLIVAGKGLDEVFELDLEHDVHTALQVEAEVDFLRLDFLVRVAQINFFSGNGIDITTVLHFSDGIQVVGLVRYTDFAESRAVLRSKCRLLGELLRLLGLDAGDSGERQLPDAGQDQEDSYKSDCSFTLHSCLTLPIILFYVSA